MDLQRIALIYDHRTRPETTGSYCLRALTEMLEVEHFHPDQLDQVPSSGFDLYLFIDDGFDYLFPERLRPNAWWAIDTHLAFDRSLNKSRNVDWVFAAQKDGAAELRAQGIESAMWLPLACDPDVHARVDVPKRHDVCFVGNLVGRVRTDLVALVRQHFRNVYVGQDFFEEMARRYSESKIVFNRSVRNDVNMRVFEALASGSLLMTNDLRDNGLHELFQDGAHLATYSGPEELLDKVEYYLRREEKREAIAAAGRQLVLSAHTYQHRMKQLLLTIEAARPRPVAVRTTRPQRAIDPGYFEHARPELLALVPGEAREILDIGCAAGRVGEAIKSRQAARVVGVEIDPMAAALARKRLDKVVEADLDSGAVAFDPGSFECVICADVLEHLRHPAQLLRQIRGWLKPTGLLLASVPNVRHHSVVRGLLNGNWTYERAGLLDSTHLRFFTRRELEKLLYRTGFALEQMILKGGPGDPSMEELARDQPLTLGRWSASDLERDDLADLHTYQYLVVARPDVTDPAKPAHRDQAAALAALRQEFPWPEAPPDVERPERHLGWLNDVGRKLLAQELSDTSRVVLELGAWLGMSTRYLADRAPNATVITIDHWLGSSEHHEDAGWQSVLPHLYEKFLIKCWDYRDRVIPLRMDVLDGLRLVAARGISPELIYVDAEHEVGPVTQQLRLCAQLFPDALLVGDDFDAEGVHEAVEAFAGSTDYDLTSTDGKWPVWKLARRSPASRAKVPGLTSIVIVTFNQLEYTRLCLESIRHFTDEPFELIVVDNGSTDGTPGVMRAMSDVRLIENPNNRGFPAGANQGLAAAAGEQVVLLNNDCVVTTGWLRRMLAALASDPGIGLVGPCSNRVSGPQQVAAGYEQLADLDGFAWEWGRHNDSRRLETERLVGFCLLIRRSVVERIGLLDERFGLGNFEDDDYCRRAREAGFKAVIALDSFVHHFGGQTFRACGVDFPKLLKHNELLYREKWAEQVPQTGAPPSSQPAAELQPSAGFEIAEGGGLRLTAAQPRLSLCMIVRDSSRTLGACLASIRPWVDELVVVDTGSTDDTPQLAERFGARVFHFPWCDSFSKARNESFLHARGEWLFWMDSDDTIDEQNGRALRALVQQNTPADVLGYVMQVHCPSTQGDGILDATVVDHVKLLRNLPEMRFEGRIHEQILPAIRRLSGRVEWSEIFVVHSGSDRSREGQAKKLARDLRLLELEHAERPDHPFTLFNLGMTYNELGRHAEAIQTLQRSLEMAVTSLKFLYQGL
ncbi:MAG: glycosyltransferase [Pirellulales bacterium]